ncbi:hypothetical protein HanXRQr2_Chr14g0652161 [Helianthus annuus]|uniref:Uncharacterized protein n=1 Tax=Helianthus annuus TaxID=4232 RepID=A0A9K3EC44_HELAN|nr:hypothetical protein HanXRQr2_Chr14g0652161 [Helianthus annuus]KAJ0840997.1 hypothetical protein HanPSC8_Chr14g0625381 [Helianthus annuus]
MCMCILYIYVSTCVSVSGAVSNFSAYEYLSYLSRIVSILHVSTKKHRVLKEFSFCGKNDESNIGIAQDRDLMSFLQQTCSSFGECYLSANFVLDPLQLHPSSPHLIFLLPKP